MMYDRFQILEDEIRDVKNSIDNHPGKE
jgi:hypothetical protein